MTANSKSQLKTCHIFIAVSLTRNNQIIYISKPKN